MATAPPPNKGDEISLDVIDLVIRNLASKWKDLARKLPIVSNLAECEQEIRKIEHANPGDLKEQCNAMLVIWCTKNTDATVSRLVQCLQKIEQNRSALDIVTMKENKSERRNIGADILDPCILIIAEHLEDQNSPFALISKQIIAMLAKKVDPALQILATVTHEDLNQSTPYSGQVRVVYPEIIKGRKDRPQEKLKDLFGAYYLPNMMDRRPKYIIAHSPLTAQAAFNIRNVYFPSSKVIIINHCIPSEVDIWLEGQSEDPPTEEKMILWAQDADTVVSAGKKVHDYFSKALDRLNKSTHHHLFFPFNFDFHGCNLCKPESHKPQNKNICAVSCRSNLDIPKPIVSAMEMLAKESPSTKWDVYTKPVKPNSHEVGKSQTTCIRFKATPKSESELQSIICRSSFYIDSGESDKLWFRGFDAIFHSVPFCTTKDSHLAASLYTLVEYPDVYFVKDSDEPTSWREKINDYQNIRHRVKDLRWLIATKAYLNNESLIITSLDHMTLEVKPSLNGKSAPEFSEDVTNKVARECVQWDPHQDDPDKCPLCGQFQLEVIDQERKIKFLTIKKSNSIRFALTASDCDSLDTFYQYSKTREFQLTLKKWLVFVAEKWMKDNNVSPNDISMEAYIHDTDYQQYRITLGAETKLDTILDTKPHTSQETEPDTSPETKPDTSPETKPDTSPETKPETKPDTSPVTKPDTSPETKPDTSPETKPDTSPVTKPDTSPETKPDTSPVTKPDTCPVTKPDTSPVTKPDTSPETKPDNGLETKPESSTLGPAEIGLPIFQQIVTPKGIKAKEHYLDIVTQLKRHYKRNMSRIQRLPWDENDDVDIHDIFVNLSLLEKGPKLFSEKGRLIENLDHLFSRPFSDPLRISIIAKAGLGKTTCVYKLASEWGSVNTREFPLLCKYQNVFVVSLRYLDENKSLAAILMDQIPSLAEVTAISELETYLKESQSISLLILDGFDEYNESSHDINKIIDMNMYRNISLLVTSRPWKVDWLQNRRRMKKFFQIIGFTLENIKIFIQKFFSPDIHKAESLLKLLESRDMLSFVKAPLILLFICLLWEDSFENASEFPQARAQLYQQLTNLIFKRAGLEQNDTTIFTLGKIAYNALISAEPNLLFDERKMLRELFHDTSPFKTGLLSHSRIQRGLEIKHLVSFPDKSYQEYCAGVYLHNQMEMQSEAAMTDFKSMEIMYELENVLVFICGMSSHAAEVILTHAKQLISEYHTISNGDLTRFSLLCLFCMKEAESIHKDCMPSNPVPSEWNGIKIDTLKKVFSFINTDQWENIYGSLTSTFEDKMLIEKLLLLVKTSHSMSKTYKRKHSI